ncbi:MAG: exopolyphosphatase [Thermodesulfobacteriota bacterium]
MRIVTRPDFDGVVCAALLFEAEEITEPIQWVEPNEMQKGAVAVQPGDIIANLPYHEACSLWFDHHYTNQPDISFEGAYKMAPSAAGVIYEYYGDIWSRDYDELIRETDRIDSADLTMDEVLHPENYPYILLSMTITGRDKSDATYWNRVVDLLRSRDIDAILQDPEVQNRCRQVIEQNRVFKSLLKAHTRLIEHVTVTDFRPLTEAPQGNRFLVYSLYPEAVVSVKVRYEGVSQEKVIIGVGHSIFNRNCKVNVGLMLSGFGGGGHRGAGSCTVPAGQAEEAIATIVSTLLKNEPNE